MEDADKKVTVLSFVSPGCRGYKTKSHGGGGGSTETTNFIFAF